MSDAMDSPGVHDRNADQAAYWNGPAGQRWTERQEKQDAVLAPASAALFVRALVAQGMRVIDVGCGCGETTIELARRVGPKGHVIGVDISAPMLARARERAHGGLPLDFVLADATVHPFQPGRADLLFSRFGVMFFADPEASFVNLRKALRPGGRVAFAGWQEPHKNPWMMLPLEAAYQHVPRLPEVGPEDPGPFSFAREDRVRRILSEAGFSSIAMEPVDLVLDIAVGRGLDAAVNGALSIGPVSRVLDGQPPDLAAAVADSIRAALAPLQKADSVPLGAAIWIATATAQR
jgi:ubiquinone/menaquinone biosynthesis C-methylase UbiE